MKLYRTITDDVNLIQTKLNDLAKDGWELKFCFLKEKSIRTQHKNVFNDAYMCILEKTTVE